MIYLKRVKNKNKITDSKLEFPLTLHYLLLPGSVLPLFQRDRNGSTCTEQSCNQTHWVGSAGAESCSGR